MAEQTAHSKGRLLTPAELADHLQVSTDQLSKWRIAGTGPTFRKLDGRNVRYHPRDVLTWLDSCARSSTSEAHDA